MINEHPILKLAKAIESKQPAVLAERAAAVLGDRHFLFVTFILDESGY